MNRSRLRPMPSPKRPPNTSQQPTSILHSFHASIYASGRSERLRLTSPLDPYLLLTASESKCARRNGLWPDLAQSGGVIFPDGDGAAINRTPQSGDRQGSSSLERLRRHPQLCRGSACMIKQRRTGLLLISTRCDCWSCLLICETDTHGLPLYTSFASVHVCHANVRLLHSRHLRSTTTSAFTHLCQYSLHQGRR